MKRGQIVNCNLKLRDSKGNVFYLKDTIFSFPYDRDRYFLDFNNFEDRRIINKTKKNENLTVLDIEIIQELGWKHRTKDYTEAKKNDEKRNNITGAYE